MALCPRPGCKVGVVLVQRGAAIHLRLARAEPVEVGTVQDQKLGHGKPGRNGRPVCAKRSMLSRSPKFRALARFKRLFEFWLYDRQSVVEGQSVSVRVDIGARGIIKKKKRKLYINLR